MKRYRNQKNRIKIVEDNKGSTIVMVLIAVLFVSVLVSIILSSVVVNMRMRAIDRKTKDEFYYAEKALNDVYAGLGENCANALGSSYNLVMSKYTSSSGTYQDQVQAYDEFCKEFLKKIYVSASSDAYGLSLKTLNREELIDKMNSYIVGHRAKVVSVNDVVFLKSDKLTAADTSEDKYPGIKYTIIKGVKIVSDMTASANSGYVSGVTADIVIETPQIDFFTVNEKGLEYALAANDGIEFNGNAVINGSVYGGSRPTGDINKASDIDAYKKPERLGYEKYMTDASDYGGILINGSVVSIDGEYVISGGDIYVKKAADSAGNLNISYGTKNEVWFDNLTLEGDDSYVNISGDLYAQGDLQVEGKNSKVIVNGNYYGYNDGSFESKTDKLTDAVGRSTANASSKFSSIIVNSKEASVSMDNLDTLVLLGKAYINHESNRTTDPTTSLEVISGNSARDDIGESVALRSGQEIFLCPSEFLNGDTNPNIFDNVAYEFNVDTETMKGWFGWQYLNQSEPTKTVKLTQNGVNRAYCYLNFGGSNSVEYNENQRKFVADVVSGTSSVSGTEPSPETINYRLKHINKLQHSEIRIGNADTRIYANGSIVEYKYADSEGSEDTISVRGNTEGFERFKGYSGKMHYKYQRLCTYLDSMSNSTPSGSDININDFNSNELPFGRLFWEAGIRKIGVGDAIYSRNLDGEAGGYVDYIPDCASTVIVCRGKGGDSFYEGAMSGEDKYKSAIDISSVLSNNGKPNNVFMIIDGDAYVKDNVTINGFIYVSGELIVEKGATLNVTYNSTLLDKRIESELKKLKEVYQDKKKANPLVNLRDCYDNRTLIYYLLDYNVPDDGSALSPKVENLADEKLHGVVYHSIEQIDGKRKYRIDINTGDIVYDVTSDYTQFMYFDNWKKGQ